MPAFRCVCQSYWLNVCFCRIRVLVCHLLAVGTWCWGICCISETCSQRKGNHAHWHESEEQQNARQCRHVLLEKKFVTIAAVWWVLKPTHSCNDFQWNEIWSKTLNYFSWAKLSPVTDIFALTTICSKQGTSCFLLSWMSGMHLTQNREAAICFTEVK